MKVLLNDDVLALGITASDVQHMLKACDKYLLVEVYNPTAEEVLTLMREAREKELAKKRRVEKWDALFSKLK